MRGSDTFTESLFTLRKLEDFVPVERVQIGSDVMHEQGREAFAEAVRPMTGMDAKQLAVQGRRRQLSSGTQRACQQLDGDMPLMKLFQLRKRFQDLAC